MWTISYSPVLDVLSEWNTYTSLACQIFYDTEPIRLCRSRKWCFIGYRHLLKQSHKIQYDDIDMTEMQKKEPTKKFVWVRYTTRKLTFYGGPRTVANSTKTIVNTFYDGQIVLDHT